MKPTTSQIIKDWLQFRVQQNQKTVYSHNFEIELVKYGEVYWGVKKLPSAYSREWRKIRSSQGYKDIGIHNVKKLETKSNEGVWELITTM